MLMSRLILSFLLHSPGSSDTTSLNAELKVELHKLEILRKKNKHVTADWEQTADTKRSFLLANTIQSTTTPRESLHPTQRGF